MTVEQAKEQVERINAELVQVIDRHAGQDNPGGIWFVPETWHDYGRAQGLAWELALLICKISHGKEALLKRIQAVGE